MDRPDFLARYTTLVEQGEDATWDRGQLVFEYVRDSGQQAPNPRVYRKLRAATLKELAALVKRTTACIRQELEVYAAFGHEALRSQEHCWTWHRAVLRSARRNHLNPAEVLTEAIEKQWHIPDLNALGKVEPEETSCTADCPDCGARVAVRMRKDGVRKALMGLALCCPVCIAIAQRDGGDAREAHRLGALE